MSDRDLAPYQNNGGDLAPYAPSPLAPIQPDTWGNLSPREIDDYQQPNNQQIFGQTLPSGVTTQQVQQAFVQIANVFQSDFQALGHNSQNTQKAVNWFQQALVNPPQQQRQRHRYNLFEHKSDPIFQAFANYAHDNNFSAKMVSDACWWVTEATKRLSGSTSPETASTSTDPTDQLTDAEFQRVIKINDQVKGQTLSYLQTLWGHSFHANLQMVNNFLAQLPAREQAALDKYTTGWIHALNTKEVILGLYRQAIGSNSLPTGGALSTEIAEHERVMKYDRKRWNGDERLQARYRTLLDLRDRK